MHLFKSNKRKFENPLHQVQFKVLTPLHPISELRDAKSLNILPEDLIIFEQKFENYREFPRFTSPFFRIFYVEIFRFLIRELRHISDFKSMMEQILLPKCMKECQQNCKVMYSEKDLIKIYERVLLLLFEGRDELIPEEAFERLISGIAKDEEIDKLGILMMRGYLLNCFTNIESKCPSEIRDDEDLFNSILKNRKNTEKYIKQYNEDCDEEPLYQVTALKSFSIRLHIYDFTKAAKIKLPPGKIASHLKKIKIKMIRGSEFMAVLTKKSPPNILSVSSPATPSRPIINDDHGMDITNETPNFKDEELALYVADSPVRKRLYDGEEEVKSNLNGEMENQNKRKSLSSLKKNEGEMRLNMCQICGCEVLINSGIGGFCDDCMFRCHICMSDSTDTLRYKCSHNFCYICTMDLVTTYDEIYDPKFCPLCGDDY